MAENIELGERADHESQAIPLTRSELTLLANALNEVLHGTGIEESEFSTRLGAPRVEAERLLSRLRQ